MKYIIILCLIFAFSKISAQEKVISLHPLVGDTIDNIEFGKYYLFTEYSRDSLDYIILTESNKQYFLHGYHDNEMTLKNPISKNEMLLQKENIEKLERYYSTMNVRDSINICFDNDSLINTEVNLNFKTPEFYKSLKKERRWKFWKEKREESRANRKNGMLW